MLVYRICHEKWAQSLKASGYPARWNSKGVMVIYTAATRALACLENLVHRSGEGENKSFRVMIIDIPDSVSRKNIDMNLLSTNWFDVAKYSDCRRLGDLWAHEGRYCMLKVPSAIIPDEINYLINPNHPDFKQIRVKRVEAFRFDKRFTGK
jgi:RES domain-containing protein